MTDTIPAAADTLPTRRRALASLAGLTAALSLPTPARAATVASVTPSPMGAIVQQLAAEYEACTTRELDAIRLLDEADEHHEEPAEPDVLFWQSRDFGFLSGFR